MIEPGQHARLAVKAFGERGRAGQGGRQQLQRNQAVQLGLARPVDGAHATRADQLQNLEMREGGRDRIQGGRRWPFTGGLTRLRRGGHRGQRASWAKALHGLRGNRDSHTSGSELVELCLSYRVLPVESVG